MPLTRVAVGGGLDPVFVGAGRAVVAAVLAAVVLLVVRPPRPRGKQWIGLGLVALGVVVGFPLLTSFALQTVPASHAAVVVGILPALTAVCACLRTGERPRARFWGAVALGAAACVAFVVLQGASLSGLGLGDLLIFAAALCCAVGYAEGGILSRSIGSWQTICWALLLAAPIMAATTAIGWAAAPPAGTPAAWASFAYLGCVSMFLGFFAWYRGLALGPMLQVSQVQLSQPLLSLLWAWLLLGERFGWLTLAGGVVVIACTALAVRSR